MFNPAGPEGTIEVRALINGRVQGVGFRFRAKSHADRLGVRGTVSNLDDGSVELYAQGESEQVASLIESLKAEPEPIRISTIETEEIFPRRSYSGFRII